MNHVARRMGTALRKLASEGRKSGTSRWMWVWEIEAGDDHQADRDYGKAIRNPGLEFDGGTVIKLSDSLIIP